MKCYALIGLGGRSEIYMEMLTSEFKNNTKLVAICDLNLGRLEYRSMWLKKMSCTPACYLATDFDKMLREHKPDAVIICTVDSTHDDYICRTLKAGCDVLTEKPMTTDELKCQRIIDTVLQTGRNVRVTFNYRYSPVRSQVKKLLMSGVIGKPLSVEFQYLLDTLHGADYFHRWHRNKKNSGGLLVHKSTHHFDLINWWLSDIPVSVTAQGNRLFYNENQARRYGLSNHGQRCSECDIKDKCHYCLDLSKYPRLVNIYVNNEKYDGYYRDRCVFGNDIDIEDCMNVMVRYKGGAVLSYSLTTFSPWEGYRVAINGTKGRLEHACQESSYINGDGTTQGAFQLDKTYIRIFPHFKTPYSVPVLTGEGGHGGGDVAMMNDIFGNPEPDPLKRYADYVQGAYSLLIGAAANKSMVSGDKVNIDNLVKGLSMPDYPKMTFENRHIEYVSDAKCVDSKGAVIGA